MVWVGGITAIVWSIGKKCGVIRVDPYEEILGMDFTEHSSGMTDQEKSTLKSKIESLERNQYGKILSPVKVEDENIAIKDK